MDKLIITDLNSKARRERVAGTKLRTRRVTDGAGKTETVYIIDAAAPDFDDQFTKLFQRNVTRAIRAQRKRRLVAAE